MDAQKAIDGIKKDKCSGCHGLDEAPQMCESCAYKMAINAIEQQEKIQIALASMEYEAEFCGELEEMMVRDGLYDSAGKMKVKEEAFRDCVSMIKEELGMV